MKRKIKGGLTSVSLGVFIADTSSTTGGGLSGVTNSSSGLVLEYRRAGQSTWTSVTPVSKTLGTYTSGGIVADGSLAGAYEVDFPDAAFASGARFVLCRIRGVTNMLPVLIEVELDAVDYQDSTRFGLGAIPNVAQGNSGALSIGDASGRVTLAPITHSGSTIPAVTSVTNGVTVSDKTGFSLASNGLASVTAWTVAITGNITGNLSGFVGSISGVTFPANFGALSIDVSGQINSVGIVDELGPNALLANDLANEIGVATFSQLTTYAWPADSLGKHMLISNDNNRSVKVIGAGAGHVAADVHELQPGVIVAADFDATALTAIADGVLGRATSTSTYDAGDVGYVLRQVYSMIVADGVDWQYTANALELAPAGGGGGGGTDWTSSERTAIRSILGFNSSGSVVDPTTGILDEIRDDIGAIGINVYPISASTPERVSGTTLTFYRDESRSVSVATDFTLTSMVLEFVVEDAEGNDVLVVPNASISRSGQTFTVAVTTAVTGTVSNYRWSLRDITSGNSVIARGVLTVQDAASNG